jgi:calcineurin-like phosphoesterase family protein
MKTFFTADTHFKHANIIRYCKRPQLRDGDEVSYLDDEGRQCFKWSSPEIARIRCKEMDEMLKTNWNNTVTSDDEVYHLGDVVFGSGIQAIDTLCSLQFRKLYFVWGNHDGAMEELYRAIKANRTPPLIHNRVVFLGNMKEVKVERQLITLNHFAMKVWNKSHHSAWHLYGHSHGSLPDDPNSMSLDVGVDVHNYRPISFEEVASLMAKKTFKSIDHHKQ